MTGNVLVQAIAHGRFPSLAEARRHAAQNLSLAEFEPRPSPAWSDAARRYAALEERHAQGADVTPPPLLEARHVTKAYAGVHALRDVSFELLRGRGPRPRRRERRGQVDAGQDHHRRRRGRRRRGASLRPGRSSTTPLARPGPPGIAAIYQQPALFPDLTVAENIAIGLEPGGAVAAPWTGGSGAAGPPTC